MVAAQEWVEGIGVGANMCIPRLQKVRAGRKQKRPVLDRRTLEHCV